jgi:hypothetical protein
MMRITARQAIVVDKYLKLALAQGRAVEMRQIIDRGTCGVHRRLIDKVYLTEERRVAGGCVVERREIAEKGHPRRAMLLGKHTYRRRKFIDCVGGRRDLLTRGQVDIRNM